MHLAGIAACLTLLARDVLASPVTANQGAASHASSPRAIVEGESVKPEQLLQQIRKPKREFRLRITDSGGSERVGSGFEEVIGGGDNSAFNFRWEGEDEMAPVVLVVPNPGLSAGLWAKHVKNELKSGKAMEKLGIETPKLEEGSISLNGKPEFPVLLRAATSVYEKEGAYVINEKDTQFAKEVHNNDEKWREVWEELLGDDESDWESAEKWEPILEPVMKDIETLVKAGWTTLGARNNYILHTKGKRSIRMFMFDFGSRRAGSKLSSWKGLFGGDDDGSAIRTQKREAIVVMTTYARKALDLKDKEKLKSELIEKFAE